ncbi:MAG: helix-turn-helix transcriptional regulator [Candidatus Aminicenantes bacterium]|nr:helix-turn-helix transcriptional regulator [Candidatus Aminicenantes bacterium]
MKDETKEFIKMIGKKISQIRKKKGISQIEISRLTKISRSQISRIERGSIPSYSIIHLFKIAKVLDVEVSELVNPHRIFSKTIRFSPPEITINTESGEEEINIKIKLEK